MSAHSGEIWSRTEGIRPSPDLSTDLDMTKKYEIQSLLFDRINRDEHDRSIVGAGPCACPGNHMGLLLQESCTSCKSCPRRYMGAFQGKYVVTTIGIVLFYDMIDSLLRSYPDVLSHERRFSGVLAVCETPTGTECRNRGPHGVVSPADAI